MHDGADVGSVDAVGVEMAMLVPRSEIPAGVSGKRLVSRARVRIGCEAQPQFDTYRSCPVSEEWQVESSPVPGGDDTRVELGDRTIKMHQECGFRSVEDSRPART